MNSLCLDDFSECNPVTVPLQVPACHVIIYVVSGNQAVKQTIPPLPCGDSG